MSPTTYIILKTQYSFLKNLIPVICCMDFSRLKCSDYMRHICSEIPESILRVKGCAQMGVEEHYTYFEHTLDGTVSIRPYYGIPKTVAKLVTRGSGSEPTMLQVMIDKILVL